MPSSIKTPETIDSRQNLIGYGGVAVLLVYAILTYLAVFYFRQPSLIRSYVLMIGPLMITALVLSQWVSGKGENLVLLTFQSLLLLAVYAVPLLLQWGLRMDATGLDGRSALDFTYRFLVTGWMWFFVGAAVQFLEGFKRNLGYSLAIIGISALLIGFGLDGGFVVSYNYLNTLGDYPGITHLEVSDTTVFVVMLAYALCPAPYRILVGSLSLAILFAAGGRTAFYVSILSVYIVIGAFYGKWKAGLLMILASLFIFPLAGILKDIVRSDQLLGRMLFIGGAFADDSWVGRLDFFIDGFRLLPSQIFIGNASIIVREFGSIGAYMHSILSVVQFFGLAAFFYTITLGARCVLFFFQRLRQNLADPITEFAGYLLIHAAIAGVFTKFFGYSILWFSLGFWIFRMGRIRTMRSRQSIGTD